MNNQEVEHIANLAVGALIKEATLTPKPGLVDAENNGAHDDMDSFLFIESALALLPFFKEYIVLGNQHQGTPKELFAKIRGVGQQAETAMMIATNHVNTHKGANFSFALFLTAIGKIWQAPTEDFLTQIITYIQKMTENITQEDYAHLAEKQQLSYGEKLYLEYGITGIRGEAEAGYPAIMEIGIPTAKKYQTLTEKERYLLVLLHLMSKMSDSNIIHRGKMEGLNFVQHEAQQMINQLEADYTSQKLMTAIKELDKLLIEKHLSPGGAADTLALIIFLEQLLYFLEKTNPQKNFHQ